LSGSDIHIYLRPRDLASAEFISAQMGNRSEIVPHFSHSPGRGGKTQESVTFNEQNRPVMFAHDVMSLPNGAAICIAPGRSKHALQIWARPWFDCPDLKHKGGLDPYHRHRSANGGHKP
jgi:type IV secretory pathway TraG/TraD family ATPase VirD4